MFYKFKYLIVTTTYSDLVSIMINNRIRLVYAYDSIIYECGYKNGKKHGIGRYYDEAGAIRCEEKFVYGNKVF